jgi:phage shock protein PspC (stress-responsive transcriptional regulator)
MTKTELQTTLREMWQTRPTRPPDDRQVAGVAAAIARRYDIDPTLVRVGFAVTAFAGVGALLYIACWIALPDGPGARISPRPIVAVGLAVATAIGVGSIVGVNLTALLAGIITAGLLVLLHRERAGLGLPGAAAGVPGAVPPGSVPPESIPPGTVGPGTVGPDAADPAADTARRPPAWDQLGVAPSLWDLPEPPPAPVPPTPPTPRVTAYTLAAALVAGGLTGITLLITGGGVTILLSVLLAVLGTGLVIGAFLRAGRGLVPVAVVTALIAWAVLAFPVEIFRTDFSDTRITPPTAAAVAPVYPMGVGNLELDLRQVDLAVPPGTPAEPLRTSVTAEGGNVEVWVPPNADVTFHGAIGFGHVGFGERNAGGPDSRIDVVDDLGADGVRSGQPLIIDMTSQFGNLEVHRG